MDAKIPFRAFCNLMEEVSRCKGTKQRIELIEKMWMTIRGGDFFPFMRLLLPHLDTARSTYGIRMSKVAKYYIEILGLAPTSGDAVRLTKWKDPTKSTLDVTHFSDVVFAILTSRGHSGAPDPGLSTKEVNERLDELAGADSSEKRRTILMNLLRLTSAVEQKWFIRIMLKDMRIHVQHTSILGAFHPSALEIFNATNSLQNVCEKCSDLSVLQDVAPTTRIALMQPLKPMLAGHVDPGKLTILLQESKVIAETKFDGERIMIHKNGNEIQYWTRNAKNYNDIYGPKFNSIVLQSVKAHSVILDGEMLVWDAVKGQFKDFGSNRTHGNAAQQPLGLMDVVATAVTEWFCYCVFDIVLCDGEVIAHLPLDQRKARLDTVVNYIPNKMERVAASPVTTIHSVLSALDTAIEKKYEGIMLKVSDSAYIPGERKLKWLKLKADHIHGLADSLDLIVLGAYFGTKYGQRHLSHFLLGVWVDTPGSTPSDPKSLFHTITKVGTGYSDSELKDLLTRVGDKWKPWERQKGCPPHFDGWKPAADDIPDVWIDPRESIVLEIIGYSFNETVKFRTGFTLRFPRCLRVRYDKNIDDAMTLSQVRSFYSMSINTKKAVNFESEFLTHRKVKKASKTAAQKGAQITLPPRSYASVSLNIGIPNDVKQETSLFEGYEFCVLQSDHDHPRELLERLVLANGGSVVANPTPSTAIVVASSAKSPKVVNWTQAIQRGTVKKYEDLDIVHHSWLMECVNQGKVIPFSPQYMLFVSKKLQALFEISMDPFMDSYFDIATKESLSHSLQLALKGSKLEAINDGPKKRARTEDVSIYDLCLDIHSQKFMVGFYSALSDDPSSHSELFGNTVMYFATGDIVDPSGHVGNAEFLAVLHGACAVNEPASHPVTHVVLDPAAPESIRRWGSWGSGLVVRVGYEWVFECVKQQARLNVKEFVVLPQSQSPLTDSLDAQQYQLNYMARDSTLFHTM